MHEYGTWAEWLVRIVAVLSSVRKTPSAETWLGTMIRREWHFVVGLTTSKKDSIV